MLDLVQGMARALARISAPSRRSGWCPRCSPRRRTWRGILAKGLVGLDARLHRSDVGWAVGRKPLGLVRGRSQIEGRGLKGADPNLCVGLMLDGSGAPRREGLSDGCECPIGIAAPAVCGLAMKQDKAVESHHMIILQRHADAAVESALTHVRGLAVLAPHPDQVQKLIDGEDMSCS